MRMPTLVTAACKIDHQRLSKARAHCLGFFCWRCIRDLAGPFGRGPLILLKDVSGHLWNGEGYGVLPAMRRTSGPGVSPSEAKGRAPGSYRTLGENNG